MHDLDGDRHPEDHQLASPSLLVHLRGCNYYRKGHVTSANAIGNQENAAGASKGDLYNII